MVKTYEAWCKAVANEAQKLRAVSDYLSDDGQERLNGFSALEGLIPFSETSRDLLEWFDSPNLWDSLSPDTQKALGTSHVQQAYNCLKKISIAEEVNL